MQLVGAMEELKQCRLQQRNISATVDKLTQCLPGERPDGGQQVARVAVNRGVVD